MFLPNPNSKTKKRNPYSSPTKRLCRRCKDAWLRTYYGKKAVSQAKKIKKETGEKHALKSLYPETLFFHGNTRFCDKHMGVVRAEGAKRRAAKIQQSPTWADQKEIKEIYKEAVLITKATGIKHEVDHIVPLRGKNVRGLHVASNLRIITASENRKKSNKLLKD